ncbi:MAG: PT domain-containing protein, partial [Spirochaetales bacterium]|nr:PT domain-containing protein [Spirochaetales bacterium]
PTTEPTTEPTAEPTAEPTEEPTAEPTEEPTAEPTALPTPGGGGLAVQYQCGDTNATNTEIKPHFIIVNLDTAAHPLSEMKIRYYYTLEGSGPETVYIDYAAVGLGNVTASFQTGYLEVGFTAEAGDLPASDNSGEIHVRFHKNDWTAYNEANDYSFDASKTAYTDWENVTLYFNGTLVWGYEP